MEYSDNTAVFDNQFRIDSPISTYSLVAPFQFATADGSVKPFTTVSKINLKVIQI